MLHGHAVASCMGFGAYLSWKHCDWINEEQCLRICKLINDLELSLWHDIMSDKGIFHSCTKKMIQKRGGNLAAPLPRGEIGNCGYLNDITDDQLSRYLDEYKVLVTAQGKFARNGYGVQPHLADVGLAETSAEATAHVRAELAHDNHKLSHGHGHCHHHHDAEEKKDDGNELSSNQSYQEWIKNAQTDRNADWKFNVQFEKSSDTVSAPHFPHNTLFHNTVEPYAMSQTTAASHNIQTAAKITAEEGLFAPCMVGSLESEFLKIFAKTSRAKCILDIGTFTGMSAIAFAEGSLAVAGSTPVAVHTLEADETTAKAARKIFDHCDTSIRDAIRLHHTDALEWMRACAADPHGPTFDIMFIDADKDAYRQYYALALGDDGLRPLLSPTGTILADNTLSALVYDEDDFRRDALHQFNQTVKNDPRVEQAVLTVREGISIITRV
uniref:Uncharacterized protein n=1 Tax=Amphora coffeiformis TaxID=265554 RepID=A0A7S3L5J5_9STRA